MVLSVSAARTTRTGSGRTTYTAAATRGIHASRARGAIEQCGSHRPVWWWSCTCAPVAVGEYVSVSSQRDAEHGDLVNETAGAFVPAALPGVDGHERRCVVRSSWVRAARPSCSMRSISERAHPTSRAAAMPYGGLSA